jgi:S-adenosylmethionine:tRNA ribosyltransferase-isomerase
MDIKELRISEYTYNLPEEKIAKYPLEKRDESKLLIYKKKTISESVFKNISTYLPQDHLLVMNNTKVIYARLHFRKKTGAKIEIFCLNPYKPAEYNLAFEAKKVCQWQCIVGNLKKWKEEKLKLEFSDSTKTHTLTAKKKAIEKNNVIIEFEWDGDFTFAEVLEKIGEIPIPPYLKRESEEEDKQRYQTIYSKLEGSVAAPTAGLHFTQEVLDDLKSKGIHTAELTLHVGAGTFKPVKSEKIAEHEMHTEQFYVTKETIVRIKNSLGKIISVGTTSMRTLESLYWIGVKLFSKKSNPTHIEQWEVYNLPRLSVLEAFDAILNYLDDENKNYLKAKTQIIIVPGYEFKVVDILVTNFHQPQSTLLLLVAAFVGNDWKKIYNYALENNFRFLSYGDSSLLFRNE